MAKVKVDSKSFSELWALIGYYYINNPNIIKSPEVVKLFEKLKTMKCY